ncbi:hypothetical protein BS333_09355 [Vibrio azureus]|uniref:DUF4765 domain-containing protein n=2 Tax=Vibrio azureus TaxID=512649 RepID=U3AKC0_9VIBR|nr:DUF4765 family protein [Vibrio azureus]AUI86571.1 hypothetical protein BS333_09355 [Vibrio azureus]GAD74195.1 hypothetical protein VAZ01S_004_00690 [Vibrio azureus NBRC 104587]
MEDNNVLHLDLFSIKDGTSEDASDVVPFDFFPTDDDLVRHASSDEYVVLWRGTNRVQAENILQNKTASGVSKNDVIAMPELKPKKKIPSRYAKKSRFHDQIGRGRNLPEYTASKDVGNGYARDHYLVVVEVKRSLLTQGSRSESGWILEPNANVKPIAVVDCTLGKPEPFTPNGS